MKIKIYLILFITTGFIACNENELGDASIPSVVINGFFEYFPNATGLQWKKRAAFYEADFEIQKLDYKAILNAEGVILKYKHGLTYNKLPEAIQARIADDFDQKKVENVELLQIMENRYYQVEFDEKPQDKKWIFEESGKYTTEIMPW